MKTIVFVRSGANPRMYNQVYALKKSNKYRLILLCRTFDETMLGKFREAFDEIICYQPLDLQGHGLRQDIRSPFPIHFMKYVIAHYIDARVGQLSERMKLPPLLKKLEVDMFNCLGTFKLTANVIKNAECPVILDFHNGSISRGIENLSKEEYEVDKYCFGHANGIVHRGPEFEMDYYRNHGYKINCPTLHYVDCCNKEFFANHNVKKLSDDDGEYHLVNMGGGYSSLHAIHLFKKLGKQKIHSHLYFIPYSLISPVVFKEFVKLNKTEKYFHLEKAVPFDKTPQEISKYDFGALMVPPEIISQYTLISLKSVVSNRLFTYLEAGLPIIINDRIEYMNDIIKENRIGISIKDKELDNIQDVINRYNYEELRENVLRAREKLLIDNYAERLVKFYDDVIQR